MAGQGYKGQNLPRIFGNLDYLTVLLIFGAVGFSLAAATYLASHLDRQGFPLGADDRFLGIDGLRGYLALCVMMHHFIVWLNIARYGADWTYPPVHVFNQLGAGAVLLFFMVTGFLFYPLIKGGILAVSWHIYLLKRVLRIVPLAFLSVCLAFLVLASRSDLAPSFADFGNMLRWIFQGYGSTVFNDPNAWRVQAGVFWTLAYEWNFYVVIVPISALLVQFLPKSIAPIFVPIFLVALGIGLLGLNWDRFLILFALGMLVRAVHSNQTWKRIARRKSFAALTGLCMIAAVNLFQLPFGNLSIIAYLMFFVAVAFENPCFNLLKRRSCQVLGACSFGIYVLHGIFLSLLFTEGANFVAALPLALLVLILPIVTVLTVQISAFLHIWVERPAILAGARLGRLRTKTG